MCALSPISQPEVESLQLRKLLIFFSEYNMAHYMSSPFIATRKLSTQVFLDCSPAVYVFKTQNQTVNTDCFYICNIIISHCKQNK